MPPRIAEIRQASDISSILPRRPGIRHDRGVLCFPVL